ncbi:MAG: hypothetical protein E7054_08080 [Lentisphaerae bacterium]|nr:hypothetical protein [Lentisphaerota bacterium]
MNSFVKKNGVLVGVLALSGIAALTLLIFIFINLFGLFDKIDETRQASDRVRSLNKSRPAPCEENEKLIKSDIAVLDNAIKGLRGGFDFPLQVAVDEFIKVLEPPLVAGKAGDVGLNEEEYENFRYVYPGEDDMDSEKRAALPKKARKLSLDDFKKLYSGRFEREYGENSARNMLSTQELFIDSFSRIFSNWDVALQAFVKKARPLTVEPIMNVNDESILLSAMGFPRALPLQRVFNSHMEEYSAALRKIVDAEVERRTKLAKDAVEKAAAARDAENQLKSAIEAEKDAAAAKAVAEKDTSENAAEKLAAANDDWKHAVDEKENARKESEAKTAAAKEAAEKAREGGAEIKIFENPEEIFYVSPAVLSFMSGVGAGYADGDVREVYFQRDVVGNLLKHVVKSGVKAMHNIAVRRFGAAEEGRSYGTLYESIGDFNVHHYTIEVSGTLQKIRALCESLDQSYKVKRFYIVRAVTLYAEENKAAVLMGQNTIVHSNKNERQQEEGRGRRRRRQIEEDTNTEVEENAARKMQELEEKLPFYQRKGYGDVLIGQSDCRAFIDIDYVLPQHKQ